jgi:hypothetical protein
VSDPSQWRHGADRLRKNERRHWSHDAVPMVQPRPSETRILPAHEHVSCARRPLSAMGGASLALALGGQTSNTPNPSRQAGRDHNSLPSRHPARGHRAWTSVPAVKYTCPSITLSPAISRRPDPALSTSRGMCPTARSQARPWCSSVGRDRAEPYAAAGRTTASARVERARHSSRARRPLVLRARCSCRPCSWRCRVSEFAHAP